MVNEENMFNEMEQENNVASENDVVEAVQESNEEPKEDSVFDYNKLSGGKALKYERVNLDGQIITVEKAEIKMPTGDWVKSRSGEYETKSYWFTVYYDTPGKDHENYSGMKGFKNEDGTLGAPAVQTSKNKTQAAKLFNVYKKYIMKSKKIDEVEFDKTYGLKHFLAFLNSKPKAKITATEFEWDDKITVKNIITEFI